MPRYAGHLSGNDKFTHATRHMQIPSKILDLVADLETRAAALRREHAHDHAAQLTRAALELRAAYDAEPDTLLTLDQAVAWSRGYNADYLARVLTNVGKRSRPLYRKGDVPRKPA
jgi:hypothetical protein